MANLAGAMSSIGGFNLDTEAATKFSEMMKAFNSEMPLLYGYISEWDWYAEMLPCVVVGLDKIVEHEKIVGLIAKPEPTEEDRKAISAYMDAVPISSFAMKNHPNAGKAWAAFNKYELTWPSPFFKGPNSAYVYGWPNTQANDPRRTGKVVVFKDVASTLGWLLENSYKYGFVWYGPTDEVFIYVGAATAFSADFKAAALLGLQAGLYNVYKQAKGKAPETKQEAVDWVTGLTADGYVNGNAKIQKTLLEKSWIAWDIFMNKVQ